MENTFTWEVRQLDTIPDFNGYINFVKRIHWTYIGTCENNVSTSIVGYFEFDEIPSDYIDYSEITKNEVVAWCEKYTNTGELKDILNKKIFDILNPPIINLPLPWVPQDAVGDTAEVIDEPIPDVVPDVVPDVIDEPIPEVIPDVIPDVIPEVIDEVIDEPIPDVIPEVIDEVIDEPIPDVPSEPISDSVV